MGKKGVRTTIVGQGIEIDLGDDSDEEQDVEGGENGGTKEGEGFDITDNPWMAGGGDGKGGGKKGRKGKKGKGTEGKSGGVVDFDKGVGMIVGDGGDGVDEVDVTMAGEDDSGDDGEGGGIGKMSQNELVRKAFATGDEEEEFKAEKRRILERDEPKVEEEDDKVQGWGNWAGSGVRKPKKRKKALPKKLEAPKAKRAKRADDALPTVIINEKRIKKVSKFKVASVPYPFTSAEQYERSLAGPVGAEWQTSQSFVNMTRPEVLVKAGRIINPIGKRGKKKGGDRKARF